jgi:chemotaxis protein methyltransferase CheR
VLTDLELVAFLQWALPRRGLRWEGFRNFRGTVRKRLGKRMTELGIDRLSSYRLRLESSPEEWAVFDAMCRIPISRFYRDRAVFELLRDAILPERACAAREGNQVVRVWSAGCASGEEPYSVAILWYLDVEPAHQGVSLELVATDVGENMIARARHGCYEEGSLRAVPSAWRMDAFRRQGPLFCVRDEFRRIEFRCEDLRVSAPEGPFDVVLCRNIVWTYFDEGLQRATAARLLDRLKPNGVVVLGSHETWPPDAGTMRRRGSGVYELAPARGDAV